MYGLSMLSGLTLGESTGFGDGDPAGAVVFDGANVAACRVGEEENFDDKLDSHDPFRAGDDDLCRFCTVGCFSTTDPSIPGRCGIGIGDTGEESFVQAGPFSVIGEVFDVLLFEVVSMALLASLSLRP